MDVIKWNEQNHTKLLDILQFVKNKYILSKFLNYKPQLLLSICSLLMKIMKRRQNLGSFLGNLKNMTYFIPNSRAVWNHLLKRYCHYTLLRCDFMELTVCLYIILSQEESLVFILVEGQRIWRKKVNIHCVEVSTIWFPIH